MEDLGDDDEEDEEEDVKGPLDADEFADILADDAAASESRGDEEEEEEEGSQEDNNAYVQQRQADDEAELAAIRQVGSYLPAFPLRLLHLTACRLWAVDGAKMAVVNGKRLSSSMTKVVAAIQVLRYPPSLCAVRVPLTPPREQRKRIRRVRAGVRRRRAIEVSATP